MNGKHKDGATAPGLEVFNNWGTSITTFATEKRMLLLLIAFIVCRRCPEANSKSTNNFRDRNSRELSEHPLKKFRTCAGSHVTAYLGFGGRNLKIERKKRFTSGWDPTSLSESNESAAR